MAENSSRAGAVQVATDPRGIVLDGDQDYLEHTISEPQFQDGVRAVVLP